MASKKKSDWPPAGWKVEVKRKSGRIFKCYVNSKNHKKFYSKAAVLRYIGDGCISDEQHQPVNEDAKKSSGKTPMHAVKANYIEWLPTGWVVERRIRKSGTAAGTEYKCYIDPSTGIKFFSKPEVLRYLGSKECSPGSSRRKDRGGNGHSYSVRLVDPPSVLKSSLKTKVSQLSEARAWKSLSSGKQKVIIERTMDQELPSGWIKETRIKMLGNKVVRRDSFFNDPASALVFRSKLEVLRYLETGEISKHAYRRRTGSIIEKDIASGKTHTTSSGKREETPKRTTRKQLISGEASTTRQSIRTLTEGQDNENAGGKKSKRSSSRVRSAPSGVSSLMQSNLPPKSTKYSEDMVVAKPLLEIVSGTKKTVGTIKHTPPIVQDADAKYMSVKNSERSALSRGILSEENNPVAATIQRCSNGKAQAGKRKTRHGKLSSVPSRSSKRLAGVDAEIVFHPIPIEHACRAITRNSSGSKSIPSLVPISSELQRKHQTVDMQDGNKRALRATCSKTSRTKPVPSLASVPSELQEKFWDADMQDVLAFQEEKNCTPDVNTEFVLATEGQPSNKIDDSSSPQKENSQILDFDVEKVVTSQGEPSNKIDDLTSEETKHHILDGKSETALATQLGPLDKLDDLTSPEEEHCTLDVHRENVISTEGEPSNKIDDLRSEETKHCILDVNRETVLATLGEPSNKLDDLTSQEEKWCTLDVLAMRGETSNKIDDLTTKSPLLVDLNFLQLEQAPPGFSKDSVKLSSASIRQSLEHPTNSGQDSKVESTPMVVEEQPGSIQRETEQPQNSELCFSSPLWSDPCLEFAYKTLTGAIPFDDNLAIQDYIQHQLRTSEENNSNQLLPDICAPSNNFRNDEANMVSQLPEDANFSTSNGFGSPEIKQVKNK